MREFDSNGLPLSYDLREIVTPREVWLHKLEKYRKQRGSDDCWVWLGGACRSDNPARYGKIICRFRDGKQRPVAVHRLAYWAANPDHPPSRSEAVLRQCLNSRCVNPAHLRLGAPKDAMALVVEHGLKRGERNPNAKLNKNQVKMIRHARAQGISYQELAVIYGVDPSTIRQVTQGKTWPHVGGPLEDLNHA